MKTKIEIIFLHETVWQSWGRDAGTLALMVAAIGLGVYLQSTAMQWVGAIILLIWLFLLSASSNAKKMSVKEAQAYLATLVGTEDVKQ